jgi:three-Cys-motif partner protein
MPTTWPLPDHTAAKHKLLRAYLGGWYPILARWEGQVIYLDAFAGPGVYRNGEPGSPIVALQTLLDHRHLPSLASCEFRFNFLEPRPDRLAQLRGEIEKLRAARDGFPTNVVVRSRQDTFEDAARSIVSWLKERGQQMPPTFAFIDPFGPKGLPMAVIRELLDARKCEVCVHFMLGFVNRWIRRGRRDPHVAGLFATNDYRQAEAMRGASRQRFLLDLYQRQLREVAGFRHVTSFNLFGLRNQWISAIVYGTNSERGMEVMKAAKWRVDPVRGGRFSDRDHATGQLDLFGGPQMITDTVRFEIANRFRGARVPVAEVARFVVLETDFGPQHWKGALRAMESARELRVAVAVPGRRAGQFPEGTVVEFK